MKANNPRIERLKEMLALEERRAKLQEDLSTLLARMSSVRETLFERGGARTAGPSAGSRRTPVTRPRKAKRGALKEKIMAALEAAGATGVHVKDLAATLATKPVNIHSWFHSTSKRNPAIKKISGGHYRLERKGGTSSKAAPNGKTTPRKTGQVRRGGRQSRRGELSRRIVNELQRAGSQGITVRELAGRLGTKYKNTYIWFATTGKKNAKIRKIGPATYKIVS
jgi:hypothetical protein